MAEGGQKLSAQGQTPIATTAGTIVKPLLPHVRSISTAFERVFVEREDFEVLEETGFEQIYNLFRYATEVNQEDVVVVDAMTFSENPAGILAGYCAHLGVAFDPGSLSWESREVRRWESWDRWHTDAQQSTGIKSAERKDPALSGKLQEAYEYCLPYYYTLGAHAIPGTVRTPPPARRIGGGRHEVHRS